MQVQVIGQIKVLRALRERRDHYRKRFTRGIGKAASLLHDASGFYVPIDTGRLWNTSYVRPDGNWPVVVFVVAYTAPYSVSVHEDLQKAHGRVFNYKHSAEIAAGLEHARRPQEQAKFLERPARDPMVHKRMVLEVVAEMNR